VVWQMKINVFGVMEMIQINRIVFNGVICDVIAYTVTVSFCRREGIHYITEMVTLKFENKSSQFRSFVSEGHSSVSM
jgi:hypothetical protein